MSGARRATYGRVALLGALLAGLLIVALHAVKPELDPAWRFVSEYAIGANGWLLSLAFLVWSASCVALVASLRAQLSSRLGRTGNHLLLVVAAALAVAGVFAMDPVTVGPGELTTHGRIHAIASMIGIPGMPVAALLISLNLAPRGPETARDRSVVRTAAHFCWISLAIMAVYLTWAVPRAGGFGPDVSAGWMNRLVVAAYLSWLGATARYATKLRAD